MKSETVYRVAIERDEAGAWLAHVKGLRGCHTHGRTLDQVRRRIRGALSLWVEDADTAELLEEIRLPGDARQAIQRSSAARTCAERGRENAQRATTAAAKLLVERQGLGVRDAGELLGLRTSAFSNWFLPKEGQPRSWHENGTEARLLGAPFLGSVRACSSQQFFSWRLRSTSTAFRFARCVSWTTLWRSSKDDS